MFALLLKLLEPGPGNPEADPDLFLATQVRREFKCV